MPRKSTKEREAEREIEHALANYAPHHFRHSPELWNAWLAGAHWLAITANDIEGWAEHRIGDRALGKLNLLEKEKIQRREPRRMISELTFLRDHVDELLERLESKDPDLRELGIAPTKKPRRLRPGSKADARKHRREAIAALRTATNEHAKPDDKRRYLENLILLMWHRRSTPRKKRADEVLALARDQTVKLLTVMHAIVDRWIAEMGPFKGAQITMGYVTKMREEQAAAVR